MLYATSLIILIVLAIANMIIAILVSPLTMSDLNWVTGGILLGLAISLIIDKGTQTH